MTPSADSAALSVTSWCREHLPDPSSWPPLSHYPQSLALCLLDAVWAPSVRYDAHVRPLLTRYAAARSFADLGVVTDGPEELLRYVESAGGPEALAQDRLTGWNAQRTSTAPSGVLKAEAVCRAAELMAAHGILTPGALRSAGGEAGLHAAWRSLPGQGSSDGGWRYLLHLAGEDLVPPDRRMLGFVSGLAGSEVSVADATRVLAAVARHLEVPLRELDHHLWRSVTASGSAHSTRLQSGVERGIPPLGGEQLGVCAALDDGPVLHDEDEVGVADRREAVGDDERGATLS